MAMALYVPECVMLSSAPVAFLWTRMSLDLASLVSGPSAPERAILALFSSCVARFVMQPTALHCTSTLGESICRISGVKPPSWTIRTLFSAITKTSAFDAPRPLPPRSRVLLLTARLPNAALAARCTSMSGLWSRNRMGSRVSRSTSRTSAKNQHSVLSSNSCPPAQQPVSPLAYDVSNDARKLALGGLGKDINVPRSVISAKVREALRWRSMLSEKTRVLRARRGSPEKKSVSPRCRR